MEKLKFDNRARRKVKTCPCGRSNKDGKFSPLQGFEDKGKCHSCGVFFPPNSTTDGEAWRKSDQWKQALTPPSVSEPNFIDEATVNRTLQQYDHNHLTQFLNGFFQNDPSVLANVIKRFSIGTAKEGKTVFWQRDILGNYRSGQIMLYDPMTGKRHRELTPYWVHSLKKLNLSNFNLAQCFFGEHQLSYENKTVAIVEAAKTAAIMTPIEPRYTWIATGGAGGLTLEKCEVLKGRNVVLYPDIGIIQKEKTAFELWSEMAIKMCKELKINVKVSELLENYVSQLPETDRNNHIKSGFDIADYAIKFDWYGEVLRAKQPKIRPLSIDELTLQSMMEKQPLTKTMIQTLGLVNAKTLQPFQSI